MSDEIWYGNIWGKSIFLGVSHTSVSRVRVPHIFWDPATYARMVWPGATKFVRVAYFMGQQRPHPKRAVPKIWGMLAQHTVWPGGTKFGTITHVRVAYFRGQQRPHPKRAVPKIWGMLAQHPSYFWDLLQACTQYEKWQPNFAWWSKKVDVRKIFTGSAMKLFAVAYPHAILFHATSKNKNIDL